MSVTHAFTNSVETAGVPRPASISFVFIEHREHAPVVVEPRGVPVSTRIMVASGCIMRHQTRHIRSQLAARLIAQRGTRNPLTAASVVPRTIFVQVTVVSTEHIVLPRIGWDRPVGDWVCVLSTRNLILPNISWAHKQMKMWGGVYAPCTARSASWRVAGRLSERSRR